jgi:hypothetical protein
MKVGHYEDDGNGNPGWKIWRIILHRKAAAGLPHSKRSRLGVVDEAVVDGVEG